ncbi:MAG TPA: hypothetical protein PLP27_07665 [Crocinitomicaceae bacterium]|nr:hypothetical protein [Crocinitomicaceae bacterium]
MKNKILLTVVLFAFNTWELLAQGCSQCKIISAQQSSPTEMDETAFTSNINYGILYLIAFPYLIILFFYRKQVMSFLKSFFNKQTS